MARRMSIEGRCLASCIGDHRHAHRVDSSVRPVGGILEFWKFRLARSDRLLGWNLDRWNFWPNLASLTKLSANTGCLHAGQSMAIALQFGYQWYCTVQKFI